MKILVVGTELLHADGKTLIDAFCNSGNAPKHGGNIANSAAEQYTYVHGK
jgi:hypothetical protein